MEEVKKSKLRAAGAALNPIHQVGSAAGAGLRPAVEGWGLLSGMLARLARRPAQAVPDTYDAAEHFRLKCQRHGLNKLKLEQIELALIRTKRAVLFFLFVSLFLSLWSLASADRMFDVVVSVSLASFAVFAAAKTLQISLQLKQVRDRALYTFRQFMGLFPTKTDLAAFLFDPEM